MTQQPPQSPALFGSTTRITLHQLKAGPMKSFLGWLSYCAYVVACFALAMWFHDWDFFPASVIWVAVAIGIGTTAVSAVLQFLHRKEFFVQPKGKHCG